MSAQPGEAHNAYAERWVGTIRRELLDRTLIWNQRQLHALLAEYVEHYNRHRPHRSLHNTPPEPPEVAVFDPDRAIQKRPVCGGLINEYRQRLEPRPDNRPGARQAGPSAPPEDPQAINDDRRPLHSTASRTSLTDPRPSRSRRVHTSR